MVMAAFFAKPCRLSTRLSKGNLRSLGTDGLILLMDPR